MKPDRRAVWALVLMLTPGVCLADGAIDVLTPLRYLLFGGIWLAITCLFSHLLSKSSIGKYKVAGLTVLFFALPVIAAYGWVSLHQFLGIPGTRSVSFAESPVVVAGVTFPADSQIAYEQLGGGYWHKRIVRAQSDTGVMLGQIEIKLLWWRGSGPDMWNLALTRDQTIDGWSCSADAHAPVAMELTPGQPRFHSCQIATPKTIDGMNWPALTEVTREDNGDWTLSWNYIMDESDSTPTVIGFPLLDINATYTSTLVLKQWSATSYTRDTRAGDYLFSTEGPTRLIWVPGGDMRIEGNGKNLKTGEAVGCVLKRSQELRFTPCKRDDG